MKLDSLRHHVTSTTPVEFRVNRVATVRMSRRVRGGSSLPFYRRFVQRRLNHKRGFLYPEATPDLTDANGPSGTIIRVPNFPSFTHTQLP